MNTPHTPVPDDSGAGGDVTDGFDTDGFDTMLASRVRTALDDLVHGMTAPPDLFDDVRRRRVRASWVARAGWAALGLGSAAAATLGVVAISSNDTPSLRIESPDAASSDASPSEAAPSDGAPASDEVTYDFTGPGVPDGGTFVQLGDGTFAVRAGRGPETVWDDGTEMTSTTIEQWFVHAAESQFGTAVETGRVVGDVSPMDVYQGGEGAETVVLEGEGVEGRFVFEVGGERAQTLEAFLRDVVGNDLEVGGDGNDVGRQSFGLENPSGDHLVHVEADGTFLIRSPDDGTERVFDSIDEWFVAAASETYGVEVEQRGRLTPGPAVVQRDVVGVDERTTVTGDGVDGQYVFVGEAGSEASGLLQEFIGDVLRFSGRQTVQDDG